MQAMQARQFTQAIRARYAHLPGDGDRVFGSLCALLAGEGVFWGVGEHETSSDSPENYSSHLDWRGLGVEEWNLLSEMALGEGVAELAYYLLRTHPEAYHKSDFDSATYQRWAEQEAITALRNAILFKQLARLAEALEEIAVPVVLLKGADLARSVYPELGLRPMSDLDLLVPRAQFKEALAGVKSLGYVEDHPEALLGLEDLLSQNAYLRKAGPTGTILELHWTLVGTPAFRYAAPVDWYWANLETRGSGVYALNPTAHLLYLAAHQMLQHGGELASLRWFLDVHRLVTQRGDAIDWDGVVKHASQFGWSGAVRLCLEAVQGCFGTPLPEGLLDALGAQADPYEALMREKSAPASTHTLEMLKTLRSLNWGGRLRLGAAMLFPGQVYLRWRYQPRLGWMWPLFHVVLWGQIAKDGWRTLRVLGYNLISSRGRSGR